MIKLASKNTKGAKCKKNNDKQIRYLIEHPYPRPPVQAI